MTVLHRAEADDYCSTGSLGGTGSTWSLGSTGSTGSAAKTLVIVALPAWAQHTTSNLAQSYLVTIA